MKILVVTQYSFPEDFRINDISEELVKRGHCVTVLTGLPNYPTGNIFEGYKDAYKRIEMHNGVTIIRVNNKPRKSGIFNLLRNYLSFYKKASKAIDSLGDQFDVVYGYQLSPVMSMKPAIKYKKKYNKPFYMYVCDIWPESIRDRGTGKPLSQKTPLLLYAKSISKKIYRQADMIGTKCPEFIDYLVDNCGVDRNKCHVNYEHAESNYLNVQETPIDNGVIDFMFAGNIGKSSNCDLIVKAASKLKGNFKIHFIGDGSELNSIKTLVTDLKLNDKVLFHGRHPQNEMLDFYNKADVCLLTLSNTTAIGLTPPAKLSGYMAASRPIIAAIDGSAKTIIENAQCGFVSSSSDIESFIQCLQMVIDDVNLLNRLGENGRNYFNKNFTLEKHLDVLEKTLTNIYKNYENLHN